MRVLNWAGLFLATCLVTVDEGASAAAGDGSGETKSSPLIGTDWVLVALSAKDIELALPQTTLRFDADGNLSGFDGCNRYQGPFTVDGATLRLPTEMATTGAACPGALMRRADAYAEALRHVASYTIEGHRLSLQDAAAREVVGFEVNERTLTGISWEIQAYNNGRQAVVSVLSGTQITAVFGDDGRVTGNAGCNEYFAAYQSTGRGLSVNLPGGRTRRFCAEPEGLMDQESGYLEALYSATSFKFDGERLQLYSFGDALAVSMVPGSAESASSDDTGSKIQFDLERLDVDGLQGPPGGLRALHYEYRIPDQAAAIRRVTTIDPTLQIQQGSPGRVGCGSGELLCLGHSHQPGYRAVLIRLAGLPFVKEIREAFFE